MSRALITMTQTSRLMGCSRKYVYTLAKNGAIPAVKLESGNGNGCMWRVNFEKLIGQLGITEERAEAILNGGDAYEVAC